MPLVTLKWNQRLAENKTKQQLGTYMEYWGGLYPFFCLFVCLFVCFFKETNKPTKKEMMPRWTWHAYTGEKNQFYKVLILQALNIMSKSLTTMLETAVNARELYRLLSIWKQLLCLFVATWVYIFNTHTPHPPTVTHTHTHKTKQNKTKQNKTVSCFSDLIPCKMLQLYRLQVYINQTVQNVPIVSSNLQ